jgi:uncharacterized protein YbjT (DUF2867 family)
MIVITTPTGQIGARLVDVLLERDQHLRLIARDPDRLDPQVRGRVEVVQGSHDDPEVLDRALPGAHALFWLVPPNLRAPGAREYYLSFARAGAAAIRRHGVGHVVGVTSAGHGYPHPAGVLTAAFAMDDELAASGAAYTALGMPYYMENLLGQAAAIRDTGVLALTCAGDQLLDTIATDDIAAAAATLLTDTGWTGRQDVSLYGPDRLTPEGMASVLGDVLGRPVEYRRTGLDEVAQGIAAHGGTPENVSDVVDMLAAQDNGIYDLDRPTALTGPTDFRTWCVQHLRSAR